MEFGIDGLSHMEKTIALLDISGGGEGGGGGATYVDNDVASSSECDHALIQ